MDQESDIVTIVTWSELISNSSRTSGTYSRDCVPE